MTQPSRYYSLAMATQLIPLPEIQRLSPRVIRILGGNPGKFTLQGTNTYVVGTGPKRILIDTGEGCPSWIKALREVFQKENASPVKVLITHWHHDHVGGIRHLLEAFPETKIFKNEPEEGQSEIKNGQQFRVDGASLLAIHTPGHTQDHTTLVLENEDAIFTGDNVLGHGTAVFEDLATYLMSLDRMSGTFSGRAYPGHGPVIEDGNAKILEYIRHRQHREDQVLQVLRSSKSPPGPAITDQASEKWTSMEIVKVIYKDVPENLHIPANSGLIQVLRKLQKEDKVIQDTSSSRWSIKNRSTL